MEQVVKFANQWKEKPNVEVELRVGTSNPQGFVSDLPVADWERWLANCNAELGAQDPKRTCDYVYPGRLRSTVDETTGKVTVAVCKTRLHSMDWVRPGSWTVRASACAEVPVNADFVRVAWKCRRQKQRWSFPLDGYVIEFTNVLSQAGATRWETHELEFELNPDANAAGVVGHLLRLTAL